MGGNPWPPPAETPGGQSAARSRTCSFPVHGWYSRSAFKTALLAVRPCNLERCRKVAGPRRDPANFQLAGCISAGAKKRSDGQRRDRRSPLSCQIARHHRRRGRNADYLPRSRRRWRATARSGPAGSSPCPPRSAYRRPTIVRPPVKPYSSRRRSKIRFAVCCCFLGRDLSSKRIRSIIAMNGSSFGLAGGFVRT